MGSSPSLSMYSPPLAPIASSGETAVLLENSREERQALPKRVREAPPAVTPEKIHTNKQRFYYVRLSAQTSRQQGVAVAHTQPTFSVSWHVAAQNSAGRGNKSV